MQPATTSAQALQQLQGFQGSAKTPDQFLVDAKATQGVDSKQQQVQGLRTAVQQTTDLLNHVAPSVMGRTQNSLLTSAQANRQIQNEQAPVQKNLAQNTQDYGNANTDLERALDSANQTAQFGYTGQQNQLGYLQSLYNSLYGSEQDAAKMAEQKRQFDASLADTKAARASAGSAGGLGGLGLGSGTGTTTPAATQATPIQDQAYQSVQKFLATKNDAAIKSDYAATLKSANNGNAMDKLKIQLYNDSRADLFSKNPVIQSGINSGGLAAYGYSPQNNGLSTALPAGLRFN